jgi:DNA invertase Pin-like site-specific DNA recombinase
MLFGYMRVDSSDPDAALRRDRLRKAGCERLFEDADRNKRSQRGALLDEITSSDMIVVTRLCQLASSTADLIDVCRTLKALQAGLRSLDEPWADTATPAGWMVFEVIAGVAEFEQSLARQRTSTGRTAARERGVRFGRPPSLTMEQISQGRQMIADGTSLRKAASRLGCHYASLFRALSNGGRE